ncbi:chloride channel protein D-like [Rhinatrema bivittatum]|uniref:chloride channel protein D-like n=1 Tax=Rhinatrema bivittatum TaxID=194408 RepID=UPI00112DE71E|nr:chloride channel protein D-like [Rhinatrema bivittatum]
MRFLSSVLESNSSSIADSPIVARRAGKMVSSPVPEEDRRQRSEWDRWLLMGLIGIVVGTMGFLTHQLIDYLFHLKWELAEMYIKNGNFLMTWICALGTGLAMVAISSGLVVFLCPSGSPSGLPEVIGFLNGASMQHIFNIKTFFGTFFSCVLAIASGLFCGPEGPMIHLGAITGCGLSQFKSDTLGFQLPFFTRFRNSADKRNFIIAGAGAGIASVFRAPVGGLLFVVEEMASSWDIKLAWQTFFCCLMAAFTTDLFSSSFSGFVYRGHFGFFKAENRILFWVKNLLDMSVLAFIPTIIIGILGGLLGALFVSMNIKMNALRARIFNAIERKSFRKMTKVLDALLALILTVTVTVYVPYFFPCTPAMTFPDFQEENKSELWCNSSCNFLFKKEVSEYNCSADASWLGPTGTKQSNQTFNQAAALLVENGKRGIMFLFKRGTKKEFGYGALVTALILYFLLSCWTAGTAIASGLVIPMLYTGALYGRIVGLLLVSMFDVQDEEFTAWIDPGLFAVMGAASFFSGVSRLTISLTVIMVEITNDVQSILLIMVAVMVAKMIGDLFNTSLYRSLLKLKCIPYLESEPRIIHGKQMVNLELFTASDVMKPYVRVVHLQQNVASLAHLLINTSHSGFPVVYKPEPEHENVFLGTIGRVNLELFTASDVMKPYVRVVHLQQNVASLAHLLINTSHSGFPVVYKPEPEHENVFLGTIGRLELCMLLLKEHIFYTPGNRESLSVGPIPSYEEITVEKLPDKTRMTMLLNQYSTDSQYQQLFINLESYVNKSAMAVQAHFSLQLTYIIFRTLGLRHLTVVDLQNRVVGMITRKDLLSFQLEEKLGLHLDSRKFDSSEEPLN